MAMLCPDKLLPPTPTTTSTLTVLGPDGFAAGKKGGRKANQTCTCTYALALIQSKEKDFSETEKNRAEKRHQA